MKHFTSQEVVSILKKHGFILVSQKGSHQKWRNYDSKKQVIVADHKGRQLPEGTLRSIVKGSAIPEEDWK
jgi:predicted RNA binding protein YcfA (HicA-like mRNA interferase family)